MTPEEKAVAYDKALIRATQKWECGLMTREELEELFPELAESNDEKIRKELLDAFKASEDSIYLVLTPHKRKSFIAWLEKQKVIDVLDEEEREFVDNVDSYRKEVDAAYQKGYDEGVKVTLEKQGEQKPVKEKVWTIYDAKDGDILNSERVKATVIFKGFADDGKHILAYCGLQCDKFIHLEMPWDRDFEPASEYWKNALFEKIKEKGYEWDADAKVLKEIEQKPAWSEEDERLRRKLIELIYSVSYCDERENLSDWLKSLKDKVLLQLKQKWSKKDKERFLKCASIIKEWQDTQVDYYFERGFDYSHWLKSKLLIE